MYLGARIGKGVFVHFNKRAFINAHGLAARAPDFAIAFFLDPHFFNPRTMTAQYFARAKFAIAPELAAAGRTFKNEHERSGPQYGLFNDNCLQWHVLMSKPVSSGHIIDSIHNILTTDNAAKNSIAIVTLPVI